MSTTEEQFNAILDKIDARTNGIAGRIEKPQRFNQQSGYALQKLRCRYLTASQQQPDKLEGVGKAEIPDDGGDRWRYRKSKCLIKKVAECAQTV